MGKHVTLFGPVFWIFIKIIGNFGKFLGIWIFAEGFRSYLNIYGIFSIFLFKVF